MLSRGAGLPSGKNQANYTDCWGRFEGVWFYTYHCKIFPTIFILVLIETALLNVEVGCEQFFSLSGYVSAPCQTRLGVRTYERIPLLAAILTKVYIDKVWVAHEYLMSCKAGSWKKESSMDALNCWNFDRMLDAHLHRQPTPCTLTFEQLLKEGKGSDVSAIVDLVKD